MTNQVDNCVKCQVKLQDGICPECQYIDFEYAQIAFYRKTGFMPVMFIHSDDVLKVENKSSSMKIDEEIMYKIANQLNDRIVEYGLFWEFLSELAREYKDKLNKR